MPKNLSSRLEKLENDIEVLLMLQQVGSETCNCTTTPQTQQCSDLKTDSSIKINKECSGTSTSTLYRRAEPNMSQPQNRKRESKGDYRVNMKLTYHPPGTSPRQKCGNTKKIEMCRRSSTCAIKSKENMKSSSNACIPVEKHQEVCEELQQMRQKCVQMESTVDRLRTVLEGNRVAIQDMIQSKKLALDMAKQLREKYESMRSSRKALMEQIDRLKLENCGFGVELEKELRLRKDLNAKLEQACCQRDKAVEEHKKLQCKMCCMENKLQEMEAALHHKEEEICSARKKQRINADSPEVQEIVKKKMEEQAKAHNRDLERKTKDLHDIQYKCMSLENKLTEAQAADDKKCAEMEAELSRFKAMMEKKEKLLQTESDELKKLVLELNNLLKENEKRCCETEAEFHKYKTMTEEKANLMQTDQDELKKLVQELTNMLKQNKCRLEELSNINKQQETLIQSQTEVISSKEEQIQLANDEVDVMNRQISELENQVSMLRASVDMYDKMKDEWAQKTCQFQNECEEFEARREALEQEVQGCRCALDAEQDKLLIKTKIIDDQNESIKQLKNSLNEKVDELRRLTRELEQAEKEINQEKLDKHKLKNKITHLQMEREKLEYHVAELEDEIEKNPSSVHERLQELEMQVDGKQKEWELQLKLVSREKDQAVKAARFAAEKLFETTNQFQKQVATQKKVQRMLTSLLSEKEAQLKALRQQDRSLICMCQKPHVVCPNRPPSVARLLKQYSSTTADAKKCRLSP